MYAGKTTRLIEHFENSEFQEFEKLAVKPLLDTRYHANTINTHTGSRLNGHRIKRSDEIIPLSQPGIKQIFIDEVQFFDHNIVETISFLLANEVSIIAAGLDKDYLNRDFGAMGRLKKLTNKHEQLFAFCSTCGKKATHTQRLALHQELIIPGSKGLYEARCADHWTAQQHSY